MPKEKFNQLKHHINIGDVKHVEHGTTTTASAIRFANESYAKYEQMVLQNLINKCGEEEEKHFENLKKEAIERYDAIHDEKEDGINFSRGR